MKGSTCIVVLCMCIFVVLECNGLVVRECHDLEENGGHCNHPNMELGKCLRVCEGPHSASSDCLGDCCRCKQGFNMDYSTCQCNLHTDPIGNI
uniref:Putative secreted protein n=1 Tax=Xenopsylla cheopis TaxID=163159 RepID=A0A6M2DX56_XENCH